MGWRARAVTSWRLWLVVAVVIVVPTTWWVVTDRALDGVEVKMLASPACTGTEVADKPVGAQQRVMPQITMRPGMSCRVNLEVRNSGRIPVQLDTVEFPLMGSDGGAAVQVKEAWVDHTTAVLGTREAIVTVDRQLGADESVEVELVYSFREDGCNSPGSAMWLPTAHVATSSLLRDGLTEAPHISFRGTESSSCDED